MLPRHEIIAYAPVNGDCRWRDRHADVLDSLRDYKRRLYGPPLPAAAASGAEKPPYVVEQAIDLRPHILTTPETIAVAGEEYCYRPRATDSVCDGFTWYLESAPPGMSIDRHSGLVTWLPSLPGDFEVTLGVHSLYGASSRQTWRLSVLAAASPPATAYNAAGRTLWTEDAKGVKTLYFYTPEGAVSHTAIDLDGDLSTLHDQYVSGQTIYDEYGRQKESILDRDGKLDTTADQTATQYIYDNQGRVIKTIYADKTFTTVSYDKLGRKASETNQLGQTTYYEYDARVCF